MPMAVSRHRSRPLALVVLLENVGHIAGLTLPRQVMDGIDWITEEYAKLLLRFLGAHRRYDRVVVLEDAEANSRSFAATLTELSQTHRLDLLLLVHGLEGALVGHRGTCHIDSSFFDPLQAAYQHDPTRLDLRMVYGLNCYGASLAPRWLALGAQVCNGASGVNWLPEPSLSLFLRHWLAGASYSYALATSYTRARSVGRLIWPDRADGTPDPHISGSQQIIYGRADLTIQG